MVSKPSLTEDDFSCPVCFDVFMEPVLLACSHSVCKGCLHTFWQQRGALECPICRTVSSNPDPPVNVVLRNMCEAVLRERNRRMSVEMEGLCSIHHKALTFFCVKDQRPLCTKCRDSRLHSRHTVCSIQEASRDLKQELQKKLKPLHEKLKIYDDFKLSCVRTKEHIEKQTQNTEIQIRNEFEKFHKFLWDEEASRIKALREEEAQRTLTLKKIIEKTTLQISSVLETIKDIEKDLAGDNLPFLLNYNSSVEKTQGKLENPERLSGVLINVGKHLNNLRFQVTEKMQDLVQYTPVAFDPNTAHAGLLVSDDLMTVTYKSVQHQVPTNSERFDGLMSILGSEGFTSGNHCWEIEVGDNTAWAVGVIAESVYKNRQNLSRFGLWYVGLGNGRYAKGLATDILSPLKVSKKIDRIRVQLDMDKGKVIFTDTAHNTCLHMFKQHFNEKVFPYFYTNDKLHPLKILPLKSSETA
ncbi:tripartite motif containing 35-30 [Trichomycterus rosablanca]|uniref:tripartite motif containing 35-30 n=1 Tax=Trichomycterus rosablanca TaxID=2290929 RepID=UPI002F350642